MFNDLGYKRCNQSRSHKRGFHTRKIIYTTNTSVVIPAGMLLSILIIAIKNHWLSLLKDYGNLEGYQKIRKKSFMLK